ncbi:MAG: anaerobic C4-dicarboxylate transporter [Chlamydiota bacterium]
MIFIEFLIILTCIFIGSRAGGIALGTVASFGIALLIFAFHLPPSSPPIIVLLIIFSVVIAVSVMEAAGGLDYMILLAEKLLTKHPARITYYAPLISYILSFFTGTGHVIYAIMPIIAQVAKDENIRPERPLSVSVIASQQAITASPISAATISLLSLLSGFEVNLFQIMKVAVPSTLIGCLASAFVMNRVGIELKDDPIYQKRIREKMISKRTETKELTKTEKKRAKASIGVFLLGTILIVFFGSSEMLRPSWIIEGTTLSLEMSSVTQMIMLIVAGLSILLFKIETKKIVSSSVAQAGIIAIVSILGVAWLGNIFVEGNSDVIYSSIGKLTAISPWFFGLALFFISILLFSQAATILVLIPLGLALGVPALHLVAMYPAVNGYFFLPTYGTILAAIAFDKTGTTRIGKFVLNHSFMLPGLISTIVAITTGYFIVWLFF